MTYTQPLIYFLETSYVITDQWTYQPFVYCRFSSIVSDFVDCTISLLSESINKKEIKKEKSEKHKK